MQFHREDGRYCARPGRDMTFDERLLFKQAGWLYDFRRKLWHTDDDDKALELHAHAAGAAKERLDNIVGMRRAIVAESWAADSDLDIPAPEGLGYMPFQKAGIDYATKRNHVLIADPPGLGKTIQAIGVHNFDPANKILIVCPASLKVNWSREWRKWDVHGKTAGIAMSIPRRKTKDGVTTSWTEHDWPDTDVVIVNYDMLETFDAQVKSTQWDLAIFDEAHLLKSEDAIRTKCVFGGKKKARKKDGAVVEKAKTFTPIDSCQWLFLTGTPILSKPIELWNFVKHCDPEGLGRNWLRFAERYCDAEDNGFGLDTTGASNLEELNRFLRERFMVRRNKTEVLTELPPKRRELMVLPQDRLEKPVRKEHTRVEAALSAYEAALGLESTEGDFRYLSAIDSLCDRLTAAVEAQDGEEPDWGAAVRTLSEPEQLLFTEIAEAREEIALAKVGMVTEHVCKMVACDEPVIVFAYHKSVISEMKKRMEKAGLRVGIVTGAVSANKRQDVVDAFQAGELDVILGNILAMGVGFTLTRAQLVVFAEMDWVPALMEQAEDRAWRIGQVNAVLIQYLVVDGSIESRICARLLEKMGVIWEALDRVSC